MFLFLLAQLDLQGLENIEQKPGKCPPFEDTETECPPTENINATCLLDRDCPGRLKCCQQPCFAVCSEPVDLPKPTIVTGPKGLPGDKGDPVSKEYCTNIDFAPWSQC